MAEEERVHACFEGIVGWVFYLSGFYLCMLKPAPIQGSSSSGQAAFWLSVYFGVNKRERERLLISGVFPSLGLSVIPPCNKYGIGIGL